MELFDRDKLKIYPLTSRKSKSSIEDIIIDPNLYVPKNINHNVIEKIANEIINAKKNKKAVILSFGAYLIKNGLSLVLKEMIEQGYISHLATNGAGSIHDWEFAFQGKTEEDVRENIEKGLFGMWQETGKYLNLVLISGALREKGYGESICEMIHNDKLIIPKEAYEDSKLTKKLKKQNIEAGEIIIKHPFKEYSVQNASFSNNTPFTVHPGFGYDVIYSHPLSDGASIGKTAEIDFLRFANSVSNLEGGVYISTGSAIMSPMVFEKTLSMIRNLVRQENRKIEDFVIVVNDIQEKEGWNSEKEPSKDDPTYYLRFCKTFHRMGARELYYVQADNRDFLVQLYQCLKNEDK